MTHAFHPTSLREYDIRGIVGQTLFPADARRIGQAFGTLVRQEGGKTVCVGRDGRLSGPDLCGALVEGLVEVGITVRRIGVGPTPMLYFASVVRGADGAIMVTGSHNPPDHNGFKMVLGNRPFFGADIQKLATIRPEPAPGGAVIEDSVTEEYLTRLLADGIGARPLTVVWDAGNGAAGEVATALAARLPGRHTVLFGTIDGTFPNHHPDPTEPHNLADLIAEVKRQSADIGIAFDGDGDRIGVVDGLGRILWGDQILILLAEEVLKRHPGAPIIADVKASSVFFEEITRMGGQAVMGRTGHSLVKRLMADIGAPLAGEMSGHIFFKDRWYGFDDALYAAVRLLGVLADGPASLAERRDRLPVRVNTPELRFDCPDERKFHVVAEVKARLEAAKAKVNAVDGVRVDTADGWWLLRASNTQAVLVARCEAADEAGLERLKAVLTAQLAESGVALC